MLGSITTCFICSMGFTLSVFFAMRLANARTFEWLLLLCFVFGLIFCFILMTVARNLQHLISQQSYRLATRCIIYQISFGTLGFFVGALLGSASSVPFVVFLFVLISGFVLALLLPIIYCRYSKRVVE
jgi:hypothetical protein